MKFSPALRLALAAAISAQSATAFEYPDCADGPLADNTVCDVTASPADRAAALVKAMKIEDKLQNLVECVTPSSSLCSITVQKTHTGSLTNNPKV